ncbi:ATP synthase subunit I [Defluviitalea phaphyphila]|uniref:ATP synthase subunit I n=1 Tax=Defluviitalea phaphyphila TaxID=1473580 RepID=UPI000731D356|nr:ATP synthase subunit I [Defluviitalea phaphyphila]
MSDRIPDGKRLIIGIIITGVIIGVIGSLIVEKPFVFIKGVLFGSIFSILKLRLMELSIKKSLSMPPHKASKYATGNYMIRYIITGIILLVAALEPSISLIGTFLGLLTMKFSVFLMFFGYNIIKNKKEV